MIVLPNHNFFLVRVYFKDLLQTPYSTPYQRLLLGISQKFHIIHIIYCSASKMDEAEVQMSI